MIARYAVLATAAALAVAAPLAGQSARFEEPKPVLEEQDGVDIDLGAAFTQSFQSLDHSNAAAPNVGADGRDANELATIGAGFNLASANLYLNAGLAPGIVVRLETYLASRHHNEAWVKGGYLQMDASPIAWAPLERVMEYVTVKAGHFELNYGDAHFRRTDNGYAMDNPFTENLILDAFTTEIGAEAYVRRGPFLGMVGMTNGALKGDISDPEGRSWAFLGKVGVDQRLGDDLRVRLTASTYQNDNAASATLYGGDRAGSAYWGVMDNAAAKAFTNGRINPRFTEEIAAWQVNPFVQVGGLELFGVIEKAEGRALQESENRDVTQYAVDGVYRFLGDRLYVGARYNTLSGELFAAGSEQSVDRKALSAGWFVTPNVLLKGEYVTQSYDDFAPTSIMHGGKFDGVVVQGSVAF